MPHVTDLSEVEYLQSIWQAMRRIEKALAARVEPWPEIPAPIVHVAAPDLTDVVNAVTGLNPGATAAEIAAALADVLAPGRVDSDAAVPLRQVAEALEKLDFRLRGMGTQAYGGGSTVLDKESINQAGLAKDTTLVQVSGLLADSKRAVTDYETRLSYEARVDANPIFVGKNLNGTATSAATWVIQKLDYDVTNRLTRAQVLTGSWDGRASLGWT